MPLFSVPLFRVAWPFGLHACVLPSSPRAPYASAGLFGLARAWLPGPVVDKLAPINLMGQREGEEALAQGAIMQEFG